MPKLELSEEQVLELLLQLSPEGKRKALEILRADIEREFQACVETLSKHLQRWAEERGINLQALSDEEWEELVDGILHEKGSGCV
ncbi:hypothetical protein Q2T83_08765 [Fervidibacter sacchari]|uniref:CopG family transcriptional regulator n=1 Tax=Candidatus Fervidibacter sacchari TaxID=1448929 RepID=A0ABT2ES38_9BACT|nr:hypothetical protein [Candidatus Fervidibacter sacchari]MCS3920774.1 hypothetical protein [Candidatus Fervidibacter sacchari]WKU17888.1 hypothetical protein Q2T83_08765 [Candidatus Fervidibacter sacchari]